MLTNGQTAPNSLDEAASLSSILISCYNAFDEMCSVMYDYNHIRIFIINIKRKTNIISVSNILIYCDSILCLPEDYSKFDLPFKNRNNIKIGLPPNHLFPIESGSSFLLSGATLWKVSVKLTLNGKCWNLSPKRWKWYKLSNFWQNNILIVYSWKMTL